MVQSGNIPIFNIPETLLGNISRNFIGNFFRIFWECIMGMFHEYSTNNIPGTLLGNVPWNFIGNFSEYSGNISWEFSTNIPRTNICQLGYDCTFTITKKYEFKVYRKTSVTNVQITPIFIC